MSRLFNYVLVLCCAWAHADSDSLRLQLPTTSLPETVLHKENSIGFSTLSYIRAGQSYYRPGGESGDQSLNLAIHQEGRWRILTGQLQLKDQFSLSENWNYLDVFQAFAAAQPTAHTEVTLGRRLYQFTQWESIWRQGVFQPRYLEDRLNPETAGLAGGFFEWKQDRLGFLLALPIFIPDFGPHFYTENNKFASRNPWFHPPTPNFSFNGSTSEIHYSAAPIRNEDVVKKLGVVARLEMHQGNYLSRLSYAYKPIPQMLLAFPSYNQMHVQDTDNFMSVDIRTRILYHRLYNWDNVWKVRDWTLSASLTHELPDRDYGPEDWTSQQVQPAWIGALLAQHTMGRYWLLLGLLKVEGGDAPDRGRFASAETLFERRFQYLEGYKVALSKAWQLAGWPELKTATGFVYDRMQNGATANADLQLQWRSGLRLYAGVEFLGLVGAEAKVRDAFLSTYRANDSAHLGMDYVF